LGDPYRSITAFFKNVSENVSFAVSIFFDGRSQKFIVNLMTFSLKHAGGFTRWNLKKF